tara:strand:- start:30436 stop:30963 length:528 start_codon:yes stop_codon:yes gene_type:complete
MENNELIYLMKKISNNRDVGAFSKIFDFMAPKINAYFIKNTHNIEQSEELTQEVLSTIWLKANLFNDSKSKFTTWAFTIARNKKIDLHRKNERNYLNEQDIRLFMYENNQVNDYEIESSVNKIKEELDENQQKLIKMSFFEQKSHKKIAEELEIPLGTVKSRIRAILSKLQKFLK